MIRHFFCFVGIGLPVVLSGRPAFATTLDLLAECRSSSTDNFSYRECVGVQHKASELLLKEIEDSWREYLVVQIAELESEANGSGEVATDSSTGNNSGTQQSIASQDAAEQTTANQTTANQTPTNETVASDNRVIAIVSDETVADSDSQSKVINTSDQTPPDWADPLLVDEKEGDTSPAAQLDRFEKLPVLFRQYRDQLCAWESRQYRSNRVDVYVTACRAWHNEQRTRSMRLQLSEKRASDINGTFFSGFYIEDDQGGIFQSCDRRREWRIDGDLTVLEELSIRYDAIVRDNLEMAYLEVRGDYDQGGVSGVGITGSLTIRSINLLRTIDESDCSAAHTTDLVAFNDESKNDVAIEVPPTESADTAFIDEPGFTDPAATDDITVDALGDAGFLYGYFSSWISACAVEQTSVCMTQADAEFSTQGEWRLVIDRSLEGQWRVKLLPTISATTIGRAVILSIDGAVVRSRPVSGDVTTITTEVGVTLAQGESAMVLINQMRSGRNLTLSWNIPLEIGNELNFSLLGISGALDFFDQRG